MGTIFVAGIYGVGKSTLCNELSSELNIPAYSAGDLISSVNGEIYGANKYVEDKLKNQDVLASTVQKLLTIHPKIILAGHFCIFDRNNEVDYLPNSVYSDLSIECILLLEANLEKVVKNLSLRDGKKYNRNHLYSLANAEKAASKEVAKILGCKYIIHDMRFDGNDKYKSISMIKEDRLDESSIGHKYNNTP